VKKKTVKISANLPVESLERLKTLAYDRNVSMTEILRRAIEHEDYFARVIKQNGKVLTEDSDGNFRHVLMS